MPSECATRCMSSHSSEVHLRRGMRARVSSSRISAPPPGIESRPPAIRRAVVSRTLRSGTSAMQPISAAQKQSKWTCGTGRRSGTGRALAVASVPSRFSPYLSGNFLPRGLYRVLRCGTYRAGEFEFPDSRNQTGAGALLIIQVQASQILLIERKINILGQISLESAWRQVELQSRALGNFADMREAIFARCLKVRNDFRCDRAAPGHPDRQDTRMARHLAPLLRNVVYKYHLNT